MIRRYTKQLLIVLLNSAICLSFGFGVLAFYLIGKPVIQGFYCNDNSINKPFLKGTISTANGVTVTVVLGFLCFLIVEYFKVRKTCSDFQLVEYFKKSRTCSNVQLKKFVLDVFYLLMLYLYATGITMFITDIGKYTVGRLRPNYLSVCKPDWSKINCTNVHGFQQAIYGDDHCTTTNLRALKDARLSFPSGHASYTSCAATFLVVYIEKYIRYSDPWIVISKVFIQVGIACLAIYTSLTRISDNKHHSTDVLAGMLLGVIIGFLFAYVVVAQFAKRNRKRRNNTNGNEELNLPGPSSTH